jgi:hypothetical protein
MNSHFQNEALALLGDRPTPRPSDWQGLVRFVMAEQLQGLIFQKIRNRDDVPEAVRRFLERAYLATVAANTVRIEYLRELDRHLAEAGIIALILKGGALLETVYDDPGLRPMEDIDLLIRPRDLAALGAALNQCGFRPDPVMTAMFSKDNLWIDVHTSLMHTGRVPGRSALWPIDEARVFKDSIPWIEGVTSLRRPDEATHLIFMAHHMIKHSFSKLVWLVDLHALVRSGNDQFWETLNQKAVLYHQEKPLALVFFLLDRLFDFPPPQAMAFHPASGHVAAFDRYLLNFRLRGRSLGDLGVLLWTRCLDTRSERCRLMAGTLFPAPDVLEREYPQTRGWSWPRLVFFRCRQILGRVRHNFRAIADSITGR